MSIFDNFRKPKKRQRRPFSPVDQGKRNQARIDNISSKAAIELIAKDPDVRQQAAIKALHLDNFHPANKEKDELTKRIDNLVLKQVEENPDLLKELVKNRAATMLGIQVNEESEDGEIDLRYSGYGGPGSSIRAMLDELDAYEELRERLGGGKNNNGNGSGILGGLIDADVIGKVIELITVRSGGALPAGNGNGNYHQPAQETVAVAYNGKIVRVTVEQYNKLLSKGALQPVAAIGSGKQEQEPNPEQNQENPQQSNEQQSPDPGDQSDLPVTQEDKLYQTFGVTAEELQSYVEGEPDDFVDFLDTLRKTNDKANKVWSYLKIANIDTLIGFGEQLRDNETYGEIINSLMTPDGINWVNRVMELIRDREGVDDYE